jgi:7,8-dihydro-6-hydroxymethylpterin dimethyltransferase
MAYERKINSICPVCKKNITGSIYEDEKDGKIYLRKTCEEHGDFKDFIHSSREDYVWRHGFLKDGTGAQPPYMNEMKQGCPQDCGLCRRHINTPAICVIDVTNRCNLICPICFANTNTTGNIVEPSFEDIVKIMKHFRGLKPQPPITLQLSGGEPTMREDLPDIIREGARLGFQHLIITTNGLRMTDIEYCRELAHAGANAVYLQFDGLTANTYRKTRGADLLQKKMKVVENWRIVNREVLKETKRPGAGIALIPTIARGVNDNEIPAIIDYALGNLDVIVAVVFQPVSLCGRLSAEDVLKMRYTKSDLIADIDKHTNSVCNPWYPISSISEFAKIIDWFDGVETVEFSCHPDCSFANWLIKNEKTGELESVKHYIDMEKALRLSKAMWDKIVADGKQYGAGVLYRKRMKLKYLLKIRKSILKKGYTTTLLTRLILSPSYPTVEGFMFGPSFMVGCMHFQDAYNMDTERVRRCLVHYGIYHPKLDRVLEIPFCTYNTLHRERIEKELAII